MRPDLDHPRARRGGDREAQVPGARLELSQPPSIPHDERRTLTAVGSKQSEQTIGEPETLSADRKARRDISGRVELANRAVEVAEELASDPERFVFRQYAVETNGGPRCWLWNVTARQMARFEDIVVNGLTGSGGSGSIHRAAREALKVSYRTFWGWYTAGEDPDCPDPMKREFFSRVEEIRAKGGLALEERATKESATFAASRSPLLRGGKNDPGWSDERVMKHTGADGLSDPTLTVRLVFTPLGPKTIEEPAHQLGEGVAE